MKFLLLVLSLISFSSVAYATETKMVATWYECCKKTANGEKFNPNGHTAAHRTLPFGTKLKVTYKGRSVIVRINDRGPFVKGKHLDLARGAARAIGCHGVCVVTVKKM